MVTGLVILLCVGSALAVLHGQSRLRIPGLDVVFPVATVVPDDLIAITPVQRTTEDTTHHRHHFSSATASRIPPATRVHFNSPVGTSSRRVMPVIDGTPSRVPAPGTGAWADLRQGAGLPKEPPASQGMFVGTGAKSPSCAK